MGRDSFLPQIGREDQHVRDTERLRSEVGALDAQITIVKDQLADVGRPSGVKLGIAVLGYVAAVSVLLPIALLASRPISDSVTQRRVVFWFFASGIGALIA